MSDTLSKIKNVKAKFNSRNVKSLGDYTEHKNGPILIKMLSHTEEFYCSHELDIGQETFFYCCRFDSVAEGTIKIAESKTC